LKNVHTSTVANNHLQIAIIYFRRHLDSVFICCSYCITYGPHAIYYNRNPKWLPVRHLEHD